MYETENKIQLTFLDVLVITDKLEFDLFRKDIHTHTLTIRIRIENTRLPV